MTKPLGKMEKVELRDQWPSEPRNFTPWLADEALELLMEAIGIDLALEGQEYPVGPYKADIVCRNIENATDPSLVVIENQYDNSNHEHLGKLLTYAGNLETATIVWIAEQFTKEHKATLNWLNKNTNQNLRFFAVEINLRKIGNSLPAPTFNVVASPENWKKPPLGVTVRPKKTLTPTQKLQKKYWETLQERAKNNNASIHFQKPAPASNFQNIYIGGYPQYFIASRIIINKKLLAVDFIIHRDRHCSELMDKLEEDEKEIKKITGGNIVWEGMTGKKTSKVTLYENADPKDKNDWKRQHDWFIDTIGRFDRAFRQRIRALLNQLSADEESEVGDGEN